MVDEGSRDYLFELAPVAINGLVLPKELTKALSRGLWTKLAPRFGDVVGARFGRESRNPELFDYVEIVRGTGYLMSDTGAETCGNVGVGLSLNLDPQKCVAIGDLSEHRAELLALDYRVEPPCVRILAGGWQHVAVSVSEFLEQINAAD